MSKIRKIFDEETLQDAPPSPVSPISPTDSIYERFSHLNHHTTTNSLARDDDKRQRPTHNRQLSIASILNPEPEDDHHNQQQPQQPSHQRPHQHQRQLSNSQPYLHHSSSKGTPELTIQLRHDEALPSSWYQEQYGQDSTVMTARAGSGASWHASYSSQRHSPSKSPELDIIVEGQAAPMGYFDRPSSQLHPSQHVQASNSNTNNNDYTYDPTRSQISERYPFWPCQYQLILEEDPSQV